MTIAPLSAAGDHNPLSELLFSPRPGFVWDHQKCAVTWMNSAARAWFHATAEDFTAALSATTRKLFSSLSKPRKTHKTAAAPIQVAPEGGSPLLFLCEPLKLAGGGCGLVVTEAPALAAPPASEDARKASLPKKKAGARKPKTSLRSLPSPARALTDDELRSFKAIGRKVRKLCKAKLDGQSAAQKAPQPAKPAVTAIVSIDAPIAFPQALRLLVPAFDLFVLFGTDFIVQKLDGRPQRFGWRKAEMLQRPLTELFAGSEKAALNRLLKRVVENSAHIARDDLLLNTDGGSFFPCRAVAGLWPEEKGMSFLALTSLVLTPRLRRLQSRDMDALETMRLAA